MKLSSKDLLGLKFLQIFITSSKKTGLMKILYVLFLIPFLLIPAFAENSQILPTEKGTLDVDFSTDPLEPNPNESLKMKIDFLNPFTNKIQEHIDYVITVSKNGETIFGPIPLTHTSVGSVTIPVQAGDDGTYNALIEVSGILFQPIPPEIVSFDFTVGDTDTNGETNGEIQSENGGCLIATATFGSELAPQVQQLREIRDGIVLKTESGTSFMAGFNQFYYSFSPTIADWERESPAFKETVKISITPLLATLSVLNYVDINSEHEMLGFGIVVIMMNIGMYFVAPAMIVYRLRK